MEWTRSDTNRAGQAQLQPVPWIGIAGGSCTSGNPCNCVLRAIFRACYARFRHCATKEKHMSRATLEFISGPSGRFSWGRKDEEYVADFCLVSRRTLDDFEYKVFKFHFLLGADWRLCTRRLGIDRGNFFHAVYRIEQKLGRVFRELQPYGLFPLDEYFRGSRHKPPAPATFPVGGDGLPCAPPPARDYAPLSWRGSLRRRPLQAFFGNGRRPGASRCIRPPAHLPRSRPGG